MDTIAAGNEEAVEAWNGVLFDRFVKYRHIVVAGLSHHGDEALRLYSPRPGERALDLGCGFGDTTRQLAELVGPEGSAVGIDAAERFIETAREEAEEAGVGNVSFEVADVEVSVPDGPFDFAFARFGTMFFANPVAAMRNVRAALAPGGQLCMVVWRRKIDNDWLYRAEQVVERFLSHPEETDEPTCGPGPFSMADADTTSGILHSAGFERITFHRCDLDFRLGDDVDEAVELVMALGPAGELIRVVGEEAEALRPQIVAALKQELADFPEADGLRAPASTWIVAARAPAS